MVLIIMPLSLFAANEMNYTVVINGAVWVGSLLYYFLFAKKWFKGPKMTLEDSRPMLDEETGNNDKEQNDW